MNVVTTQPSTALADIPDGGWREVIVPAGTLVYGIEFENPDHGVGIFDGSAAGYVDGVLVDFGGNTWDWWGEPATEPGGEDLPGLFAPVELDVYERERQEVRIEERERENRWHRT